LYSLMPSPHGHKRKPLAASAISAAMGEIQWRRPLFSVDLVLFLVVS
jgi:hypothetical protein